jgi:hypothetical protein
MPDINIFIMSESPKKEEKKEKKKENLLAKALKKSDGKDDEMILHMKEMARKMGNTSHIGGG